MIQVIIRSDKKIKAFEPIHKRQIAERTFAWFHNDRRPRRNYELLIGSAEKYDQIIRYKIIIE